MQLVAAGLGWAAAASVVAVGALPLGPPQAAFELEALAPEADAAAAWQPWWLSARRDRILQVADTVQIAASERDKWWMRARGRTFMDVTDSPGLGAVYGTQPASVAASLPTVLRYEAKLAHAFHYVREQGPRADLAKFTSFYTRHYRSATGRRSQRWLLAHAARIARKVHPNATVSEFAHAWAQRTILVRIPGSNVTRTRTHGVTILGAHQDASNLFPYLRAPGADDDGSGTVTLLEALRALGAAGWRPVSDVEFHFYAAEEGGLLGSLAVAHAYQDARVPVRGMLQQDMTAYVRPGTEESVGLVTDFVSPALTDFVEQLVHAYLAIPPRRTTIGYAASDHASWRRAGYPSAFAIEAPFALCNLKHVHTAHDTYDVPGFSFPHLLQFVRLTMAFAVELGGWP